MALPELHITNGPGQRDLELAFLGRNLGAQVKFTIFTDGHGPLVVALGIYNLDFTTCQGPVYRLGGQLSIGAEEKKKLPPFNWVFLDYNAETKRGLMRFSNAE
ncbi:MAG TPA: hypothetical protein VHD31_00445 [Candidatus Paceibacterota bacterium]|nr:hypothetical protein [Candidatus Paceibacterota bacterium]